MIVSVAEYKKHWSLKLLRSLSIAGTIAIAERPADAQVRPDNTLGAEQSIVNSSTNNGSLRQEVEGGAVRGSNLFHSFREFNIPEGQSLYFQNPIGIENIISRITGNSSSNIQGTLGVAGGTANLFLLNPNGIIFGANARLDVRGSFVATTATEIQFGNQGFFSSSVPNSPSLLTVNPSAFLFNQVAAAAIVNRSTTAIADAPTAELDRRGLQVPDGRSLLLLGGDVNFVGGGVNAAGGRLELGAVAGRGTVGLSWNANDLRLRFPSAIDRADISLTNGATVNASGEGGGSIQLWGRRVLVNGGSQVATFTQGAEPGGSLIVNASGSLEVIGFVLFGTISTWSFGDGRAGDIIIETRRLSVQDGAQIFSRASGSGLAGQLSVNASESVEVSGRDSDGGSSVLASFTEGAGQVGNLTINTRNLVIRDGGVLSAQSFPLENGQVPASGEGGNLTIHATDSVELLRQGFILTETQTSGNAGNVAINTGRLLVQDESAISAQSDEGSGNAGNVTVQARSIVLRNQSQIDAETTASQGGNISLQVQDALLLREGSRISATAGTDQAGGDGGNIAIDSPFIVAVPNENSDISANAFTGRGGNVEITTQGIFGIQPRPQPTIQSDITASSEFGVSGEVNINTPDVDPTQGLTALPADVVDASDQIAIGCSPTATAQVNQGEFYQTGRGGIAPLPTDPIASSDILEDLQPPASWSASTEPTAPMVEAQGWQVNDRGEVMLVAATLPNHCGR